MVCDTADGCPCESSRHHPQVELCVGKWLRSVTLYNRRLYTGALQRSTNGQLTTMPGLFQSPITWTTADVDRWLREFFDDKCLNQRDLVAYMAKRKEDKSWKLDGEQLWNMSLDNFREYFGETAQVVFEEFLLVIQRKMNPDFDYLAHFRKELAEQQHHNQQQQQEDDTAMLPAQLPAPSRQTIPLCSSLLQIRPLQLAQFASSSVFLPAPLQPAAPSCHRVPYLSLALNTAGRSRRYKENSPITNNPQCGSCDLCSRCNSRTEQPHAARSSQADCPTQPMCPKVSSDQFLEYLVSSGQYALPPLLPITTDVSQPTPPCQSTFGHPATAQSHHEPTAHVMQDELSGKLAYAYQSSEVYHFEKGAGPCRLTVPMDPLGGQDVPLCTSAAACFPSSPSSISMLSEIDTSIPPPDIDDNEFLSLCRMSDIDKDIATTMSTGYEPLQQATLPPLSIDDVTCPATPSELLVPAKVSSIPHPMTVTPITPVSSADYRMLVMTQVPSTMSSLATTPNLDPQEDEFFAGKQEPLEQGCKGTVLYEETRERSSRSAVRRHCRKGRQTEAAEPPPESEILRHRKRRPPLPPALRFAPNHDPQLFEFLLELLHKPETYSSVIHWINKTEGLFRLNDTESVAALWGIQRKKLNMNYDKMSRALRYYHSKKATLCILEKVKCSRRAYRFLKLSHWLHHKPCSTGYDHSYAGNTTLSKNGRLAPLRN